MSVHGELDSALRELSHCEQCLRTGQNELALRELSRAIVKLRSIESKVKRLERAAKS